MRFPTGGACVDEGFSPLGAITPVVGMLSGNTVLEIVDTLGPPGTPITTGEVAEECDCSQETVKERLESLVDAGVLQMKAVGADSHVWWQPVESGQTQREGSSTGRPQVRSHPVFTSEMVGVIVWGDDLTIREANDAFLEMAGLAYEDALGTSWEELTPNEFYSVSERHISEVVESGSGVPYEKQYYHADGSRWWGLFESQELNDSEKVEFVIEITERKESEQMLERQNDQLERLKTFTDALSHDLRSPLSVIDGRLELYRETGDPDHLDTVEATTERMNRLVADLLQVAQSEPIIGDPTRTLLGDVLKTAKTGTLPESATCEYESVRPVIADADRLVQVFENLLQNSVDHGGASVTVRVGPIENGFYIEDDGPGIPEADRERIFDHGYTTREEGIGYGLSIVRSIIDAHGWDITATEAAHGGARFEVSDVDFASNQ
jgi:PAS domain S-box-containing protein